MSLAGFSVRHPILVNLFTVLVLGTAAVVVTRMSREAYPTVSTGWARVMTVLPGAGPEEVERLVTVPLEDVVVDVDGVKRIASFSSEGLSYIRIELDANVDDVSGTVANIAAEVASFRDLPGEAEAPVVREEIVRVPTLAVAVHGDVPPEVIQAAGRHLERRLQRVQGVVDVEEAGLAQRQLRIDVDPRALSASRLSLERVAQAVNARTNNLAAGSTDDGERQRVVRGILRADTAERMADVIVRPDPDGAAVRVGDVATVRDVYDDGGVAARFAGQPAVILNVHRGVGADGIRVSESVRRFIDDSRRSFPGALTVSVFDDSSHAVERTMDVLLWDSLTGLFLVLATLGLFMSLRNAVMAALDIPVAIAAGVIAMYAMGITLNALSFGALILCLGIVLDDAIVIIENIYRHLERGATRMQAAVDGTREVFWPVTSSTATMCAAFLPLLIMPGILGEFFAIIPKVVLAVLVASLVGTFLILPSHMAELAGRPSPPVGEPARHVRFGRAVIARYERVLRLCLRAPNLTTAAAFLACVALVGATLATKDFVLLTEGDIAGFEVRVRMPADASVHATDRVLEDVEARLLALRTDDVEAIYTTRGRTRTDLFTEDEDYLGMATVVLVPVDLRSGDDVGRALLARATAALDDVVGPEQIQIVERELGPPVGDPVSVKIAGESPARLTVLAGEVAEELRRVPGVSHVENTEVGEKRELQVEVDEGRAALHGLTAAAVGNWLRLAFSQAPIATTLVENERVDVVLRLDADARSPDEMRDVVLATPEGNEVALGDIATIREEQRPNHIRRNDRRRGVRVTAWVDESTTSQAASRAAEERLAGLVAANPDVSITLGGEYEETNESIRSLILSFILAIALIYVILAAEFRSLLTPLVVVATIPLSLIGVTIGFFVTGSALGLIALVSVVGLAGMAVNNAIVLVDFVIRLRAEGRPLDEAIVEAGTLRMRPILSTSITTIVGVIPLVIWAADAPELAPMAIVIAFGLTASTFLTLFVIPCAYRSTAILSEAAERRLGPLWRRIRGTDGDTHGENGAAG